MTETPHQFHVTLPSNASMQTYKTNTIANYTTLLPHRLELQGRWQVGLVDLAYPVSWHNVGKSEWFKVVASSGPKGRDIGEGAVRLSEGHYSSPKDLIDYMAYAWSDYWARLRKEMRQHTEPPPVIKQIVPAGTRLTPIEQLSKEREDVATVPDVNASSLQINFNEKTLKARIKLNSMSHALSLSPALSDILAIKENSWTVPHIRWQQDTVKTYQSDTEVDVNRGQHTLFVYCNIVEDSIVGDVQAPLLRAVTTRGIPGQTTRETFDRPLYVALKTNNFDSIEISLKTETGELLPFNFGNSFVTLHFKRVSL